MGDEKRTPWFPGDVKPFRVGVYERELFGIWFSRWDGRDWRVSNSTTRGANREAAVSPLQSTPWRGLARKP